MRRILVITVFSILIVSSFVLISCSRTEQKAAPPPSKPSAIQVTVSDGGPIVITTTTAEFQVLPSGYVQASLLKDGSKLSLDEPPSGVPTDSNYVVSAGKQVRFVSDFGQTKVIEAIGKMGRGKRIEIPAHELAPSTSSSLVRTISIEAYDDFPNLLLTSVSYKNSGSADVAIDSAISQEHRFNSQVPKVPYDMWSYQGASYDWGEDDVVKLDAKFSRPNELGAIVKGGYGGGVPVMAFWNQSVGEAIGHIETLPLTLSMPVSVAKDSRVNTSVSIPANVTLKPGDTFSTPRTFVSVYAGDYYEPLRLWSSVLAKEGWELPKPSNEAYNVSWCGWGYEFNVTPKDMLGTVPKLKELGIKWATLDDRWFDTYGDWNPRNDTFPGDSIKKMTVDFHKEGELVQLWWLPLGVEDGEGRWSRTNTLCRKWSKTIRTGSSSIKKVSMAG